MFSRPQISTVSILFLFFPSLIFARGMSSISRKIISTPKAPSAIGPYSQAVQVDNTLYISGSLGLVPETGSIIDGGVKEEAHQSLKNIGEILKAAGGSFDNVVKTTILLADINDFATVNEVYKEYFKDKYPARAAYQVAHLPKNGKVEIEAIAALGQIKDV
ncbi:Ribonuclease [Aphelenchoides besseyi]|nr:Ribonuclease [Aphelenchoides besseyi]KAI6200331.1 Ribonuclease [Aphelenchoides besseyi]